MIKEIRECIFCGNMISATGKSKRFGAAYMSRGDAELYDLYKDKDGNEDTKISVICSDCWEKATKFFRGAYKAGMLDIEKYKDVIDRHKTNEEWKKKQMKKLNKILSKETNEKIK